MTLLDTDHLTVLLFPDHSKHATLKQRLEISENLATTIVSVEEVLRGWLAVIARWKDVFQQIPAYERLAAFLEFIGD